MPEPEITPRGGEYLADVLAREIDERGGRWTGCQALRVELVEIYGRHALSAQTLANLRRQATRPSARAIEQLATVLGDRLDLRRVFRG